MRQSVIFLRGQDLFYSPEEESAIVSSDAVDMINFDVDLEVIDHFNRSLSTNLFDGANVKLVLDCHGNEDGEIALIKGSFRHPTSLVESVNLNAQLLCEVYSCHSGVGLTGDEDSTNMKQYSNILPNVSFIIHAGKSVISRVAVDNKNLTETNPIKSFLDGIISSAETAKFISRSKRDGVVKFHKYSAPKPRSAEDLSDKKIGEFLASEIQKFVEFYDKEIEEIPDKESLIAQYIAKITSKSIKEYKDNAFFIELIRQKEGGPTYGKKYAGYYLEVGSGLECVDGFKSSALEMALELGYEEQIKSLFKICDVNAENEKGETALHLAAKFGFLDSVLDLISRGAKINAEDNNYKTALSKACIAKDNKIIEFFLKAGAAITDEELEYISKITLEEVNIKGYEEIKQFLLRAKF